MTTSSSRNRAFSQRARELVSRPGFWHAASLVVGLAFILRLQRLQWFFFDEWAFIKPGAIDLFAPHVGHWSTSPILVYEGLVRSVGLDNYFPYALLVTLFHLGTAHLIWRIMAKSPINPWLATAATALFIVLGAGYENILWAFQIGFIGGLGFGLFAFLLAMTPEASRRRVALVTLISVFSLTWAGTSLPLFVATAVILWLRSGWRKASVQFGVTAAVYLVWYATSAMGNSGNQFAGPLNVYKVTYLMPEFLRYLFTTGFQSVFPIVGLGTEILLAVVVWIIVIVARKRFIPGSAPAVILGGTGLAFALLTAYSRSVNPLAGASSRYVYTIALLFLPILVLALSQWTGKAQWAVRTAVVLVIVVAASQALMLRSASARQAGTEQGSQRVISAALHLYLDKPDAVSLSSRPDPQWAPDLTMSDLVGLYRANEIDVQVYDERDLTRAKMNLGIDD